MAAQHSLWWTDTRGVAERWGVLTARLASGKRVLVNHAAARHAVRRALARPAAHRDARAAGAQRARFAGRAERASRHASLSRALPGGAREMAARLA